MERRDFLTAAAVAPVVGLLPDLRTPKVDAQAVQPVPSSDTERYYRIYRVVDDGSETVIRGCLPDLAAEAFVRSYNEVSHVGKAEAREIDIMSARLICDVAPPQPVNDSPERTVSLVKVPDGWHPTSWSDKPPKPLKAVSTATYDSPAEAEQWHRAWNEMELVTRGGFWAVRGPSPRVKRKRSPKAMVMQIRKPKDWQPANLLDVPDGAFEVGHVYGPHDIGDAWAIVKEANRYWTTPDKRIWMIVAECGGCGKQWHVEIVCDSTGAREPWLETDDEKHAHEMAQWFGLDGDLHAEISEGGEA